MSAGLDLSFRQICRTMALAMAVSRALDEGRITPRERLILLMRNGLPHRCSRGQCRDRHSNAQIGARFNRTRQWASANALEATRRLTQGEQ